MRKRNHYRSPKLQYRIPTLIIMTLMLGAILGFGKMMSWNIASFFAPHVAVSDDVALVAVSDDLALMPSTNPPRSHNPTHDAINHPKFSASVLAKAYQDAAKQLLPLLTRRE